MFTNAPINSARQLDGLYAESPSGEKLIFPLKHTEVQAKIAGNLSRVEVTQSFENPFAKHLEAIYIFPLPDEAAVDDMEIKIGDRIIKGSIKQREEAQQIYQQAKKAGRTAGLLEQGRDNIFTQSLANIQPGEQIDVTIRYTDSLKFEGGNYEFVFPMVVGPRYIPGTPIDNSGDTDRVPDAARISPPIMPSGMRSGQDIGVTVEIDAGSIVSNVSSTSHQLRIDREGQIVRVKLGREDTIPNKDLVLRYQVAGANTQATILDRSDERGGHFAVYLIPALAYKPTEIVPKDVVFLMDTSGSQGGEPIRQSQELMRRFINGLNSHDTFTIVDFANTATYLSATPLPNTPQNRTKAINYIDRLTADGGTELMNGIHAVMNFPAAPAGRLRSIVLITDGYIGNDNEILAAVQQNLKPGNRLYSFGVGSSTNRFLLNRIAEIGRGTCQVVRQDESTQEVAEKFFRQINNPVLTNIQVSWEGAGENPVIYPAILPDLFAEQPLVLFGRKRDRLAGKLHISGVDAGGQQYQDIFNLTFDREGNPAIAQLWGRSRIKDLMRQMLAVETKTGEESVTETALTYQLLSQYTAFVAVSDDVRVSPAENSMSMQVPVEMPEGVFSSNVGGFGPTVQPRPMLTMSPIPISYPSQASVDGADITTMPIMAPMPPMSISYPFQASVDEADITGAAPPDSTRSASPNILAKAKEAIDRIFGKNRPVKTEKFDPPNAPTASPLSLAVVSVTGLDLVGVTAITQYLQQLKLPTGFSGVIVFEFIINKGRVGRIVLDEEDSTLLDKAIVEFIKRSISAWSSPASATGTVRLTLQIYLLFQV